MKCPLVLALALGLSLTLSIIAEPDPHGSTPPLEFIQARVFRNLRLQDFELEGTLRSPKNTYPMTLRTREREMVYEFKDKPLQIRVVLDPAHATIERRKAGTEPWKEITGKDRLERILDTDITFEDLQLDFIHWEDVHVLGTDSIKTLPAWAFEATPDKASQYSKVRYWISSSYYAFLRVDGYNAEGAVIKRVEVNGVKKIGEAYVIEEMQVSSYSPGRDVSSSRTYIEVQSGKTGSGL